jgi:hypothetical protein
MIALEQKDRQSRFYISKSSDNGESARLSDVSSRLKKRASSVDYKEKIPKLPSGGLSVKQPKSFLDLLMTPLSQEQTEKIGQEFAAFFQNKDAVLEASEWDATVNDGLGLNAT